MLVFRDHGNRTDRQKTRLMWLVEEIGCEAFTNLVSERMGGAEFMPHVNPGHTSVWKRRDVLGVHAQKQEGLSWVRFTCRRQPWNASVPAGA
jgi:ferredoxin-nitrite reductase